MKAFPARLSQQPIFYPVLQIDYARQIAMDWNAKNGQLAGYVTQFKVEDEYIDQFEEHTVGRSGHQEFWIPAEEMENFNRHIVGHIKVVEAHFGDAFEGFVPEKFGLQGKNAVEQLTLLANSYLYKRMDFYLEIKRNHKAIFLNFPFWQAYDFKNPGLKEKIVKAIREAWLTSFPTIPLPAPPPVHDDTPTVKRVTSSPRVDPVQEDIPPVKRAGSYPRVNPVHENTPSLNRIPPQHVDEPEDEEVLSEEQTDSESFNHPVEEEDVISVSQTDSHASLHPVQEDTTPVTQADSLAVTDLGDRDTPLSHEIDPHFEQGIELGLSGEYREAIDELFKAVQDDPEDAVAHISLGVAFHREDEDERALACYESALKIDPRNAEARYFLANILYRQGDIREAIEEYTLAIGLKPDLVTAHEEPAPQDRLTDYRPAPAELYGIVRHAHRILELNRMLEATPRQAQRFKERADQYSRLGNYQQAIADYSSALALQPEDADALHARGVAYEQIGQSERAREDYRQAAAIDPQLSTAYLNRGVTLGSMGNLRQAIASLSEAIRLAPQNPDGYFNRGAAYFQQGDIESAIEDFSSVIRLSANDEAAYYWRGVSNEQAGRRREAIADYRQFLAISQDPQAREEVEQKLSQWDETKRNGPGTAHWAGR
jgi:tetratricopeptide (TPR) repeat protein